MIAGALFGVSAHLANVLPDLDDDLQPESVACRSGSAPG